MAWAGSAPVAGLLYNKSVSPSECAFYTAVGHLNRGSYGDARVVLSQLVLTDPSNERAAALLDLVRSRVHAGKWQPNAAL